MGSALASGNHSTAMGLVTKAEAYNSLAIGRYNVGGGNPTTWVLADKLFEVGNGLNEDNRSNAFTILKNGKVGIGTSTPNTRLQITGGGDASYSDGTGYLVIGSEASTNIVMDNNEIMALLSVDLLRYFMVFNFSTIPLPNHSAWKNVLDCKIFICLLT